MLPLDFLSMQTLLPFMLVLAIIYGALEMSKVFDNKAVKAIIAAVFAFFAVMNSQVVSFINAILPYAAGFFVVIFLAWIFLKPIRGDTKLKRVDPTLAIVILVLILLIFARLSDTDYMPEYNFLSDPNLLWIVGILVVVFILYKAFKMGATGQGK